MFGKWPCEMQLHDSRDRVWAIGPKIYMNQIKCTFFKFIEFAVHLQRNGTLVLSFMLFHFVCFSLAMPNVNAFSSQLSFFCFCFFCFHIRVAAWLLIEGEIQGGDERQLCSVGKFNWKWSVCRAERSREWAPRNPSCAQDYFVGNRNKLNLWNEFHYKHEICTNWLY